MLLPIAVCCLRRWKPKPKLKPENSVLKEIFETEIAEVGIPQFEAQSTSYATFAIAEVAERFSKLFLAIAQLALRFN